MIIAFLGWTVIILGALLMLIPLGIVLTHGRIVDVVGRAINPVTGRTVKRISTGITYSAVHEKIKYKDGSEEHVFHD